MEQENKNRISREDVEALAERLEAFAASLPVAERALLGLAISNGARANEHQRPEERRHRFSSPLANLIAQATDFAEGRMTVPESIVTINPGKLRAKNDEEFLDFRER